MKYLAASFQFFQSSYINEIFIIKTSNFIKHLFKIYCTECKKLIFMTIIFDSINAEVFSSQITP